MGQVRLDESVDVSVHDGLDIATLVPGAVVFDQAIGLQDVGADLTAPLYLLLFAGHGTDSLRRYLHQTLRFIGQLYSLPRELKLSDLSKRLQAISSARGLRMNLKEIEKKINALPDGREARDSKTLLIARNLYRWRQEMTHEH